MQNFQQNILTQAKFVAQNEQHVSINHTELNKLAQKVLSTTNDINRSWTELDFKHHFTDGTAKTVQWLLLSSALNFSFWDGKAEELWEVEYDGEWVKGYWALTAALKKAVQTHDILNANFLENMTTEILSEILKGRGKPPLLKERAQVCRNIGKTLNTHFNGEFINALEQANKSAVTLTNIVANNFTDFKDVSTYKGQEIPILKRAQILVADTWGAFKGQSFGEFNDIEKLTIFADYKLPQFLRALKVFEYSPELANIVDRYQIIESGSEMEVELRAMTIHAVEELKKATKGKFSAVQLDWWIWNSSFEAQYEEKPHHLTRSVFY